MFGRIERKLNHTIAAFVLMMLASPVFAQSAAGPLCNALKLVSGTNSALVAFVAGVALVIFFVVLSLNEGNQMISWAIKILIGVSGLIAIGSIMNMLFGANLAAQCGL